MRINEEFDEFEEGDNQRERRKIKEFMEERNRKARESFRIFGDEDLEIEE